MEFPYRAIRIPDKFYLGMCKFLRNKFINPERLHKEKIDMVVSE